MLQFSFTCHKTNIVDCFSNSCFRSNKFYRAFGSGSNHEPHAHFKNQSKLHDKGHAFNLLRAVKTHFAGFFLAMNQALCCCEALEAMVHSPAGMISSNSRSSFAVQLWTSRMTFSGREHSFFIARYPSCSRCYNLLTQSCQHGHGLLSHQ